MTMYARHEKEIVGQGGSFGVREATIGIAPPQHFHPHPARHGRWNRAAEALFLPF